jgi:hypothetical protein
MYIVETWDHEYADSKMIKLLSKVCAFCEEKRHVIMDCPFVPFHITTSCWACGVTKCGKNINGSTTIIGIKNSCSLEQI